MSKKILWAVLGLLVAIAIFGFFREDLFAQDLWKPEGLSRFLIFSGAFWLGAGLLLWLKPRWLLPASAVFAFGYAQWWCASFADWAAPLIVVYFLGSCVALGTILFGAASRLCDHSGRNRSLWSRLEVDISEPRPEGAVQRGAIGLAVWIFLISIAVHFPINRAWIYLTAFGLAYAGFRWTPEAPPRGTIGMAAAIYGILAELMVALKPEVSTDGLAMHLAIPEMIARAGKFAFDFQHYAWSVMPMGGDFAFTAVYLPGGEMAARLLNFAIFAAIAAMVYQASKNWWAAALFASTPLVQMVTGSLLVDNVWAAFLVAAVLALAENEILIASILFGAAFATKVGTAAFFVPAVGFVTNQMLNRFLRSRLIRTTSRDQRERFSADRKRSVFSIASIVLLVLFAAPPYVNAWIKTGNPIFPFANNIFHSPYFDSSTSLKDFRYRPPGTWDALYNVTFRSAEYVEAQNGALGFQYFLFVIPMLLVLRRKGPWIPVAIGSAGAILTMMWLPNLRYIYPALPMLSIGMGPLLSDLPVAAAAIVALNSWFLAASGWYHKEFALFTGAQVKQYSTLFAPQRKLIDEVNRIAPGEPIAIFGLPAIAGLRANAYLDTWHTPRFWREISAAKDPSQIAAAFRARKIRYLITPIPPAKNNEIQARFVETWTAPTGNESGGHQLRSLLEAPIEKPREILPAEPGTYDDLDPRIEYTGSWLPDRQFEQAFARSITYSNQPGDTARFFFSGRSITYVYTMAFNRGIAEISIDRQPRGTVDLYSKDLKWQQKTVFGDLEPGPHTIQIRVAKKKNPASAGRFVDIDRLVVSSR